MKYFVITKTLRDNYKDRTRIAHAVLADRIAIRVGNKPQANDRIAYANIVVDGDMKKMLQGDKIETPRLLKIIIVTRLFTLFNKSNYETSFTIFKFSCRWC